MGVIEEDQLSKSLAMTKTKSRWRKERKVLSHHFT